MAFLHRARRSRWPLLALVCACSAGWFAGPASAALPPQGVYEGCAPYQPQPLCADRLSQIGAGGFKLVLNYSGWYGNASQVLSYANAAQAAGVKLIWPLNDAPWRDPGSATTLPSTYSTLAPSCGCSTNSGFLQYAVDLVRSLPATWGYYIGDELAPSQAPAVAALATELRQLDPNHPLLYVGVPSSSELAPFESLGNVLGADSYPIGSGGSVSDVGAAANTIAQLSQASGAAPAMVLQAFDWSEYPGTQSAPPSWPTEAQMQSMRDEALAANPSMILWYSFYDIERSDNPAGHWQDLVAAAFAPLPSAAAPPTKNKTKRHRGKRRRSKHRAGLASLRHRRHRARHHHRRHRRHTKHHRRHRAGAQHAAAILASLDLRSGF